MFDEFVTFETAKKLKEKGFRSPCIANYSNGVLLYNDSQFRGSSVKECLKSFNTLNDIEDIYVGLKNCIDAPTISQVLKWLREEKKLHIIIPASSDECYWWVIRDFNKEISEYINEEYKTYKEAAFAGIEYVLNNLI